MAEKLDCKSTGKSNINIRENPMEVYNHYSSNVEILKTELELEEEMIYLIKTLSIKRANDEMAALVSCLEDFKSALQFIVDHRTELRRILKSPNVPNAICVKYKQQEKFVACCQKLPAIIDLFETTKSTGNTYQFLNNQQIISHMEKEIKFGKEYSNFIKCFISSCEGFMKNINTNLASLYGNAASHGAQNGICEAEN